VKHWRYQAAAQTEAYLSDGTLRVIALLWEILDGEGPLLLEEPEISLHAAAVARLPALFGKANLRDRQLILSTHAFSMFREVGIAAEELVLIRASKKRTAEASVVTMGPDEKTVVDSLKHQLSLEPLLERLTAPPAAEKLVGILSGR
ncbi:MAG: AAA family ATPase, partial [Myxococcaceae bacterium]